MLRRAKVLASCLAHEQQRTPPAADDSHASVRRAAASGCGWTEIFLNTLEASRSRAVPESLARGDSVVLLHGLASTWECERLRTAASAVACAERCRETDRVLAPREGDGTVAGRVRMPVTQMLDAPGQALCNGLLHRVVERLERLPQLSALLPLLGLADCIGSASFLANRKLGFTRGEPAINVYSSGGHFCMHQDKQALTVLLPLSETSAFAGGGTSFWSLADRGPAGASHTYRHRTEQPTLHLTPPAGTALLFGGTVAHAGSAVSAGERIVFVASFSPSASEDGVSDWSPELLAQDRALATGVWLLAALDGLDTGAF